MKFVVGKFYKTRSGEKVVYIGENPFNDTYKHIFAVSQMIVVMITDDGEALEGDEHEGDIIGVWTEPVKCWVVKFPNGSTTLTSDKAFADDIAECPDHQVKEVTFK